MHPIPGSCFACGIAGSSLPQGIASASSARASHGGEIAVGITDQKHRFTPRLERYACGDEEKDDYGFWEVSPTDASTIESKNRYFLTDRSIEVLTAQALKDANDWLVLSGYPGVLATANREGGPTVKLLTYATVISGVGPAPPSIIPPSLEDEVDLWVPAAGNVDTLGEGGAVEMPALRGASGGGCWRSGVRPSPETWDPAKIKLVGIHTGSCKPIRSADGMEHGFARECLIANHLRLIAREFEDLRAFLHERWPTLSTP